MAAKPLYVDQHAAASVLVAEFRNAAALLALPESQQFQFLHHNVYVMLDEVVGRHQVYKLFGSSFGFMLSTNVAEPDPHHATTLLACARELLEQLQQVRLPCGAPLRPVMALSTGPITSGLLGTVSLTYQLVGRVVSAARELSKMQDKLPFVATRSFLDALPPAAAAQLVPVGQVPLAACGGSQEDVFTLHPYRGMPLGHSPRPAAAQTPVPAPAAPEAEEASVPGGSSDEASDGPPSSGQQPAASGGQEPPEQA